MAKKYNFDVIANRFNTDSIKYHEGQDVLPMWVADMDYMVLPEIVEAIKIKAEQSCFGYVDILDEYYESYISWYQNKYNLHINKDYFVFSLGVVASIDSLFKHLLGKNKKVMMFSPIYHTFFSCIEHNDLEFVDYPFIYDDINHQYHLDLKNLEDKLKDVDALLLCNPHNPNGYLYSLEELNEIARLCHKHHIYLISDEIHFDITDPDIKCYSILEIKEEYLDNVITLLAPSKAFNLASIQSSVLVIPNKTLRMKIQSYVYMDDIGEPNFFSGVATVAAYQYGYNWNIEMREYVYQNKLYFATFLKEHLPNIYLVESKTLYLIWVDISYYTSNSKVFCENLKKETGLWVAPGSQFRGNGSKFMRINLATSFNNVKDACLRLESFIKKNYSE